MEPQHDSQLSNQSGRRRLWLLIISLVVFIVLIVVVIASNGVRFQNFNVNNTCLKADKHFAVVDYDKILAYNGLSFYALDYRTGERTVLNTGKKLPTPDTIVWAGTNGALLTFNSSFYLSQVQTTLAKDEQRINSKTRDYTWYYNFSDSTLSLVEKTTLHDNLVYYSAQEHGVYYLLGSMLKFLDLESMQVQTITSDVAVANITYLGACSSFRLCLIGNDTSNYLSQRLYALSETSSFSELVDANGTIYPTNRPDFFLLARYERSLKSTPTEGDEDIDYGELTATLFTVSDQSTRSLGYLLGESSVAIGFYSDNEYFLLDDSLGNSVFDESAYYRAGVVRAWLNKPNSTIKPLRYRGGASLEERTLAKLSTNSSGDSLLTTLSGTQLLFTPELVSGLDVNNTAETRRNVDACSDSSGASDVQYFASDKLFKIYFLSDRDFASNVGSFADCMRQYNSHGYSYYFGGLDPSNGRIVTD